MPIRLAERAGEDNTVDLCTISIILLIGNLILNIIPQRIYSVSSSMV